MVAAAIEIDYFKALFQALEIGPQGFVSLMRSDNFRTVLRHPMPSGWFNRVLPAGTAVREALSAGNKRATLEFTSARTGVDVKDENPRVAPHPARAAVDQRPKWR